MGAVTGDSAAAGSSAGFDPAAFRFVLGHFATGVTIVTAELDGQAVGMAANSFNSVSLHPPLVLFCPAHTSTTWPLIRASGAFAVNVLGEGQEELCRRFATRRPDRFHGIPFARAATGSPVISNALAFVDCRIEAEYTAGDHVIVVGRVVELGVLSGSAPLVFFRGGYRRLANG